MAVDTRKLKDAVAELLKKGKFEKAATQLEELIKAEPRETQHRLKLGDAWRKAGEREKSVAAYQAAAKSYSDEGQLIKAIAAVKVILEIDPANAMAQRELADMNQRRFAKPGQSVQKQGAPRALGSRAVSEIELAEGESVTSSIADELSTELGTKPNRGAAAFQNDEEPLELDEPSPPPSRRPSSAPAHKPEPPAGKHAPESPPQRYRPADTEAIELPSELGSPAAPANGEKRAPPGRRGQPLEQPLEPLDEPDLIELSPEPVAPPKADPPQAAQAAPADAPAEPLELELLEEVEPEPLEPEPLELPEEPKAPAAEAAAAPSAPPAAHEIDLDIGAEGAPASPKPKTGPQPIADLLAGGNEEEVELLSISTDDEANAAPAAASVAHPQVTATSEDLDAAFGAIVDEHDKAPPRKLPPRVPLFSELSQEAFVELVNNLDYRSYQPGDIILKEGDPGRSFFVIAEGKVRVFKKLAAGGELTLATLEEGAFFGEMAMLSGAPRTATIAAETETQLLEVSDKVLRQLAGKHPNVVGVLKNFYRQRLLNNVMAISPLFKDFDTAERKLLMEKFRMRQAAPGEVLIEQGKKSDGLYVVLHGLVGVTAKGPGGAVDLARLKEGDIFGEMSLLTHGNATATVTASVPSIVLKLPRDQFQEMILTHPQILELMSELTDARRSATDAILRGLGPGQDGMAFV